MKPKKKFDIYLKCKPNPNLMDQILYHFFFFFLWIDPPILGLGLEVRVDPCISLPSLYSLKGQ